jgi:hypothetical protein
MKLGKHSAILARQNASQARALAFRLKPVVQEIRRSGLTTVRAIMRELNERDLRTSRGGLWHPHTTNVLLRRIDRLPRPSTVVS